MRAPLIFFCAGVLSLRLALASSDDPRQGWRGDGSGSFPDANPPVKWSARENIRWKTELPARSNAGVVKVDNWLFTCAEPSTLICVSAQDGKIAWTNSVDFLQTEPEDDAEAAEIIAKWKAARTEAEKKEVSKAMLRCDYFEMPPVMGEHFGFHMEYTMPTPTTDGRYLWVVYGSGLVASYELDGRRCWLRMVAKPASSTGLAASPLLAGGRLLVMLGDNLHGLDPATGRTAWRLKQKERFGSPVRCSLGDTEYAVLTGGDVIRARDGVKVAEKAGLNIYQSAVVVGDVVYSMRDDAFSTENGSPGMMAARLKPGPGGEVSVEKLWETKEPSGFSSPLFANGVLYNSRNKFGLTSVDPVTGAVLRHQPFSEPGNKNNFGSENFPCLARAGKYLFVPFQTGRVFVLELGREEREIAVNTLCEGNDQLVGAPFFAGDRLYLRTHQFLFCIGSL